MDLLTTVRKEGSRGGRGDFKWSDVQSSSHRENYLGHSLMAPVGRWQRGRDLNWYAKGGTNEDSGETLAEKAARERKEEIQRVKEAEQDALARALGYDVPPRNPNMEALGDRKEVDKIVKEAVQDEDTEIGKGIGFGKLGTMQGSSEERIEGNNDDTPDGGIRSLRKDRKEKRRDRSRDRRHRGMKTMTKEENDHGHGSGREGGVQGAEIDLITEEEIGTGEKIEGTGVVHPILRIGIVDEMIITTAGVECGKSFSRTGAASCSEIPL